MSAWWSFNFAELKILLFDWQIDSGKQPSDNSGYKGDRSSYLSLNKFTFSSPRTVEGVRGYERHRCFSYKL